MKISLKTFFPVVARGSLMTASCASQIDKRNEIEIAEENCLKQAELDSIAYSDIFNATKLIKDSAKVAEFNKIASQHRSSSYDQQNVESFLKSKAKKSGMLLKDYDEMCKFDNNAYYQHFLDNFVYQKFFNDNGVLKKNIKKKCDKYSQYAISVLKIR